MSTQRLDMTRDVIDRLAFYARADIEVRSLQDLVERYGGYSRVPPEAWAAFDRRMQRWREEYKQRIRLTG